MIKFFPSFLIINMPKTLSYEYVKNFIKLESYQLLSNAYKNVKTELLLKCPIGHEYKTTFNNFQQGRRCPICANSYRGLRYTNDQIKTIVENKNFKLISINASNITVQCPNNHTYNTSISIFKNHGCRKCADSDNRKKFSFDYHYVKSFIESKNYKLLSEDYTNNKEKLLVECPNGHMYNTRFDNFKHGYRCSKCSNKVSKGEQSLALYVESLGVEIIKNDRSVIINPLTGNFLELDIWMPSLNKAIEYNGEYWHNKHNSLLRDEIKVNQCKRTNIDLLIIKDGEWNKDNLNCKDRIIKFLEI